MKEAKNQNVYILSLEASDIYSHMFRGLDLKLNYCGMIPYSLELLKLKEAGLNIKITNTGKQISRDIINVKFNTKVKDAKTLIELTKKKIEEINNSQEPEQIGYAQKLEQFLSLAEQNKDNWEQISNTELRKMFYTNGFKLSFVDKKTGEVTEIDYVVYKRSSSKSRIGQCLFIRKDLYKTMIEWSRMYLPFVEDMQIEDYPSLLAYESLVLSAIEYTIKINPDNILIVDDIISKFKQVCNVVKKDDNSGLLECFEEEAEIESNLFDGQALLDSSYYPKGKGMLLLRNHFFKAAAFNCDIQKFLRDHCPSDVSYEEWKLTDMFGNQIFAKDVHMIISSSCLKALKFSEIIGTKKDMWNHWKQIVINDGCVFGVCKTEGESKRSFGNQILQQMSYQMINSLPASEDDIRNLAEFELGYINKLKNDDFVFMDYIGKTANAVNCNDMMIDLYNRNYNIVNTILFRKFRKKEINDYINYVKSGKIRIPGDYCVMVGNPLEMLYHAIGQFDINNIKDYQQPLKGNEIYTKLFKDNQELAGFRNPHTSPSNVLLARNKYCKDIDRYFNLTKNIVVVNAINFPLQQTLSGCDYDSDTVLLSDNPKLLELAKVCNSKYKICVNGLFAEKAKYKLSNYDMFVVDDKLSISQRLIGEVTNTAQHLMSLYWHKLSNNEKADDILRKINILTVLSGISIDLAKKLYDIDDIKKELANNRIKGDKPLFFKYVSQDKNIKNKVTKYNCPMDFLQEIIRPANAKQRFNIDINDLLVKQNLKNANRKQKNGIFKLTLEMGNILKDLYDVRRRADENNKEEIDRQIDDVISSYKQKIKSKYKKMKVNTMYGLILLIVNEGKYPLRQLNVLYQVYPEIFLSAFKKKSSQNIDNIA
ncbi:hypothetical protein CSTERTH_06685 [Thermoclostridium stercorarium subsp. thermolacticum DSM 2910]|uniref:Uncharacterized protein n=1 Tax=Thermoclostridium stercorarium subsp. thermolacticum DSM 2910 TaxID=1121336 RepID=A0A1B1YDB1_THEST|nr:hypothetical protein [Thermoclostridium stercorarium]ANW98738.1 hypothetical protein CSTERTH_06685 [Thermoclostridium stercorarium subsp. thermolacticum DSM 2910]